MIGQTVLFINKATILMLLLSIDEAEERCSANPKESSRVLLWFRFSIPILFSARWPRYLILEWVSRIAKNVRLAIRIVFRSTGSKPDVPIFCAPHRLNRLLRDKQLRKIIWIEKWELTVEIIIAKSSKRGGLSIFKWTCAFYFAHVMSVSNTISTIARVHRG